MVFALPGFWLLKMMDIGTYISSNLIGIVLLAASGIVLGFIIRFIKWGV